MAARAALVLVPSASCLALCVYKQASSLSLAAAQLCVLTSLRILWLVHVHLSRLQQLAESLGAHARGRLCALLALLRVRAIVSFRFATTVATASHPWPVVP